MSCRISVRSAHGEPVEARVVAQYELRGRSIQSELLRTGGFYRLDVPGVKSIDFVVIPRRPGLWPAYVRAAPGPIDITLEAFDPCQPSWWHALLGSAIDDPNRGRNVTIGVVDVDFVPAGAMERVEFIGPERAERRDSPHGDAVCRIIGDTSAPPGCAPIAPAAHLVFAEAGFGRTSVSDPDFTPPAGKSTEARPDLVRVADDVYEMALSDRVDIINRSLGTFSPTEGERGLAQAIAEARHRGVIVICAAGNSPERGVAFPASLAGCIAVGAVGSADWGAANSVTRHLAERSMELLPPGTFQGRDLFLWKGSSRGTGLDAVAPGVGIWIAHDGEADREFSGTSFAAPIASGLLAVALSQDATYLAQPRTLARAAYAEAMFRNLCVPCGFGRLLEGDGIPALSWDRADMRLAG